MENDRKFAFFLGGYDAEMCTIREILEKGGYAYFDKKLKWGAKLSEYKENIFTIKPALPVFIELIIDCRYPEEAIIIDHHGKQASSNTPTSIEQVAGLLGIDLDRRQLLIAANDRGWIDGLKDAGATRVEILSIRAFDRHCQGITAEMETAAEKAIKKIRKIGQLAIVHFDYDQTAAVTDRLYGQFVNLLVFGPNCTLFSGSGEWVARLADKFPAGYFGGNLPFSGFWGLAGKEPLVLEYLKSEMEKNPYA